MLIHARQVGVTGAHGPLLAPTSVRIGSGERVLVAGAPGAGHTALGLALAGRMRPTTGVVHLDGVDHPAGLRRHVALVDAPGVTEPDGGLRLADVVGEELTLARRPAGRRAVRAWLADHDADQHAGHRLDQLPGPLRTALLADLAAERADLRLLVLDTPDRHTPDPRSWWQLADRLVTPTRSVLVLCTTAAAHQLDHPATHLGQPDPDDTQPSDTADLGDTQPSEPQPTDRPTREMP